MHRSRHKRVHSRACWATPVTRAKSPGLGTAGCFLRLVKVGEEPREGSHSGGVSV